MASLHPSLSCGVRCIDAVPRELAASQRTVQHRVGLCSAIAIAGLGLLVTARSTAAAEPLAATPAPIPSVRPATPGRPAHAARHRQDARVYDREAIIRQLQARVDMLEARLEALVPTAGAPATAVPFSHATVASAAPPPAPPPTAPPPTAAAPSAARPAGKAAGSFAIDEDAAQRALERTLTQSGALLLQPGTIEFSPGFHYARLEQTLPILLTLPLPSGTTITSIAENRVRRNELTARADFRVGLPMNAQAELGLPVTRITAQQNNTFDPVTSKSATRLGDLTLGLARTFARENGFVPDLIGRLTWNTGSGRNLPAPLSSGSGFQQLQAELIAVKRQDPLAFVASIGYARVFEKDGIKPGDATVLSVSSLLAASPATSLQLGFSQILRARQQVSGLRLDGSDQAYGLFTLGATSVLSRDLTLVTQFGIGAGGDAPRYSVNVALPILFR